MRRTALAALSLIAAAAGLTGCLPGEDKTDARPKGPFAGLSGGQILDRAAIATTDAPSLRMSGQMPDETTGGTVRFGMVLSGKGECSGTLSYAEGKADVIQTAGTFYVRYDEQFFRSAGGTAEETDAAVELLAGKWVKTLAGDPDVKEFAHFCKLEKVLGDRHVRSSATRGETTTIDGTLAIALREKNDKQQVTAYVATKGTPYILQLDSSTAHGEGTVQFRDFGKAAAAQKPEGDIIDMATLTE
ncbi:hypothetical protein ACFYNZ_17290 [Streptomyces kebangsaanensis]|uniref:Lipoprotein n=1 Tax=Streptomyces kebangsaanensis TaxID=864058 RepID=A0ABW6KXT7_9ACTN